MSGSLQPKTSQSKGQPGTFGDRNDAAIQKSKKPQQDLNREQVVAIAGDTVPIVFCDRTEYAGGVWLQPPLVKQGSANFDGVFLYSISQGEMESAPTTYRTYLGQDILEFRDNSVSVSHKYASVAAMAAAPNVSPIGGDKIFADADTAIYLYGYEKPSSFRIYYEPNETNVYWNFRGKTLGVGDTTNSVLVLPGSGITIKEVSTGIDRTSNYWSILGLNPATTTFYSNAVYSGGYVVGGNSVGTITGGAYTTWYDPFSDFSIDFYQATYGTTEPCVEIQENVTVNNQINPLNPASSGTLYGVLLERGASLVSDPTSFPSSYNFSTFADITFLLLEGDIYDTATAEDYRTSVRQLSVFYKKGVKVAKYSLGTPSVSEASNSFVDLAMHLFSLIKRVDGTETAGIAMPINTSNLQTLGTFCENNRLLFNGIIEQSVNVVDYISKTAQFFLLAFVSTNGQFSLRPLLPINGSNEIDTTALTPSAIFTESSILPGSFQKRYIELDSRRNINISLVYREVTPAEIGVTRTSTVRYSTADANDPVEQFDMTDFCTNPDHAILFAKYELAKRKHSTHTVLFDTPLLTSELIPSQIIKIQRQRKNSVGDDRTENEWYQVTNIKHAANGVSTVEAAHFPVNGSNVSKISDDVVNGTFTVT